MIRKKTISYRKQEKKGGFKILITFFIINYFDRVSSAHGMCDLYQPIKDINDEPASKRRYRDVLRVEWPMFYCLPRQYVRAISFCPRPSEILSAKDIFVYSNPVLSKRDGVILLLYIKWGNTLWHSDAAWRHKSRFLLCFICSSLWRSRLETIYTCV